MASLAPFQLYIDLPPISTASRAGSTVTVATSSAHGLATGAYVQIEGFASAGTALNGVYPISVSNSTTFTYSTTTTGSLTGTVTAAVASQDAMNPVTNYTGANRLSAIYLDLSSLSMSASGDGNSSSMSFRVLQDVTPAAGPWWSTIPDQARIRLYKKNTGSTPADSDLYFIGTISAVSGSINESGQGTIGSVSVDEVNAALDRLAVFGLEVQARSPEGEGGFSRSGSVVTVTTSTDHGYGGGQKITVANVIGGGATSFNGAFTVTAPSDTVLTWTQSGLDATGDNWRTIGSMALTNKSLQKVEFTLAGSAQHGLPSGATIVLRDVTCSGSKGQGLINATFSGSNVIKISSTVLQVKLPAALASSQTFTGGEVRGVAAIIPEAGGSQEVIPINGGEDEGDAVRKVLSIVNGYKSKKYPIQRLLNTSTTTKITSSVLASSDAGVTIPAGSLRSVLDSIVETYGGQDGKERRYWIDLTRRLNYALVDTGSVPTFPDAPYLITTSGTANPNSTATASSVVPYSLEVSYDHDTTKQALFNVSGQAGGSAISKVITYTEAGFTARPGSPIFDDVVDFPTASATPASQIKRAAKGFFIERHKPLLTGSFTLRGAGTASHNSLGFSAGYYQTGASTFALQERWEPGQYVSVVAPQYGISGLFRVESVDWSLEAGSYIQVINITFNRRSPNSLIDEVKRAK